MRPDLPPSISEQIDALRQQAGVALRSGDFETRTKLVQQAWDLIPEPKFSWNYYPQSISSGSLRACRDFGQYEQAERWLEVTREAYGPERDEVIEFYAATLWLATGKEDQAWEEFDRQYKAGRTRAFQGEDKKYLDFYLSRKKRNG